MTAGTQDRIGVLLINLGTPEGTDFGAMRRYLREFLSDKRVIEAKGPLWWLILNGIILTRRPKSSGRAYARIWNHARDESPLKTITRGQATALMAHFKTRPGLHIEWAMRYGQPSIGAGIARLKEQGCARILLFPLYPQYSAATTATAMDAAFDALKTMRAQPTLRAVPPYYDRPAYITALADSITAHLATLTWKPQVILASLHGLPQAFIDKGDPYQSHCEATVALLRAHLGASAETLRLTYQSRNGRAVWIGPDTEETLVELARAGVESAAVIAPGFAADCVETLEELQIRAAEKFCANGGRNFTMVPALNDSAPAISLLAGLIEEELSGWLSPAS